jgi:hypothetical protein
MEFNNKQDTVIDETTENFFVKKTAADLAHEAAIAAIPCASNDKPCVNRWIDAYSDCA